MGSSNSRLGGSPPSPPTRPKVNRTKHRLSSLFCGATSSSSSSQREDCAAESLVNSADCRHQLVNKSPSPTNGSAPTSSGGTGFTSPISGLGASSESSSTSIEQASSGNDSEIESSSKRRCYSESEEVKFPGKNIAESKCYQHRLGDTVSASRTGHLLQVGLNSSGNTISNTDDLVGNVAEATQEVTSPSTVRHEEPGLPTLFDEIDEGTRNHDNDSRPTPAASDLGIASQSRGDEAIQESVTPGLGLLLSDRVQERPEGSLLHVDVVSISSNLLPTVNNETSTREARRNSRRMFWDTFSSRSSRRHADFPAILFTTDDTDFAGSRRRWLLDIGDDFFDDGVRTDSWHFGRRSRYTTDRRRNSRSEFWDRLRGAATESRHRAACPLDLHPDGSCTCELDEEARSLSSISRIVLLAEALFEVLDEIHRQPESFSLSMLSVPAPEPIVDALPLRTYEKPSTTGCGDDVDQCYICLVEYEEGDKIRVLPCHHEYHMSCVDKWLKEVHGVCPLCRGEVRGEGAAEGAASSSDADAVVS